MDDVKKKLLLMGAGGSGKSSMRTVIFSNYLSNETHNFSATPNVEHTNVKLLGNLTLGLWDTSGQKLIMDNYFTTQREHIFKNVAALIYVIDVSSNEPNQDLELFKNCLEALKQYSKKAKIFCLIHKMDLKTEKTRREIYFDKKKEIEEIAKGIKVRCFSTSIWHKSLYFAWAKIVYSLIPNVDLIKSNLEKFCKIIGAKEVVLFEKNTFLVMCYASVQENSSNKEQRPVKFERISGIVKQYRVCCRKAKTKFSSLEIRHNNFLAIFQEFTSNTCILVVAKETEIEPEIIKLNINNSINQFELLFHKVKMKSSKKK
ncbi:ras-related gtp-binding a [Anaeramoeba flamelloides]|uniref:Ras-related gtp-binding a n=1 Tax=Anaeramoeba flamelloides TaxID=1746091 RepID=A0AAV7ZNI1_9EUKA|nr:ras-related gtp-binding a [Anaeramoeba flamelloides]KAJ6232052.1 ras-related gtp-binding a [Anaeramoeba flamelloides]